MYGMIVVEPKEGLPPVDREFYVMQGELYTVGALGKKGYQEFSKAKLLAEQPEYFVFNGRTGALAGSGALRANVGERIRLYVGVGGFVPSNFHVIGAVFDKVYTEGDILSSPRRNVQTTVIPAGGATVVEFTVDVPGTYLLVDHSLTRSVDRGALGELVVEGRGNAAMYSAVNPDPNHTHTELVLMKDFGVYEIVGQTRDDAAGEAFDKTAKLMGLPYPGGPQIAKLALRGEATAFVLPRPMKDDGTFDFSFSGLKTAVRQVWEGLAPDARQVAQPDLAASVQEAIVDVLVAKTVRCAAAQGVRGVLLVGGVSANLALRERLGQVLQATLPGVAFLPSDRRFITDNAAMIAAAGAWRLARGEQDDWRTLDADPEANLG
jgi:hypothetical protein